MSEDLQMLIGEIKGIMSGFEKRFEKNDKDHDDMMRQLIDLNVWRWKIIGAASVMGAVIGVLANKLF